jgi:hypothetical protein
MNERLLTVLGGEVESDDLGLGGGGGSAWTSVPISYNLADWEVIEGTWASAGGVLSQTDETDGGAVLKTNATLWTPSAVIDAEVRIPSGQAGVDNSLFGFYTGASDAGIDGYGVSVYGQTAWPAPGTWLFSFLVMGSGAEPNPQLDISSRIALDTWIKVRATFDTGMMLTVDDDVLALDINSEPASGWIMGAPMTPRRLVLQAAKKVDFRNLKLWVPSSLSLV